MTEEKTYLLKDAVAFINDKPRFSSIDGESLKHLHEDKQLKVSIKLVGAVGFEYKFVEDDFGSGYEVDYSAKEHFENIIIAEPLDDENVSDFFYCNANRFNYEGKTYRLESCDSQVPVIKESELQRFIVGNETIETNNKQPLKAETKLSVNEVRLIKLKKWIEEQLKSNPEFDPLCVSISREKVWNGAIGEERGKDAVNAFFTYVNCKDPNLITFKLGTKK